MVSLQLAIPTHLVTSARSLALGSTEAKAGAMTTVGSISGVLVVDALGGTDVSTAALMTQVTVVKSQGFQLMAFLTH